jgi:hypothetical protein
MSVALDWTEDLPLDSTFVGCVLACLLLYEMYDKNKNQVSLKNKVLLSIYARFELYIFQKLETKSA